MSNPRVYVCSLAYTGIGEVLRERRDGRLVVADATGRTHRVRPENCRELGPQARPSPALERLLSTPVYARPPDAEPRPKPETGRLPEYLAWLRRQPCARCGVSVGVEASHHPAEKQGAMGLKCPDARAIPLCARCHRTGPRAHHSRPFDRDWVEGVIAASTRAWVRSLGGVE